MRTPSPLLTERLELIPATRELTHVELSGPAALGAALGVEVSRAWPPGELDAGAQAFFADMLARHPEQSGWWSWYWVRREGRVLVGAGGFKGPPSPGGEVEVGYSVLEAHQRQGYAQEAVEALIAWAFAHPEVNHVAAETTPGNVASLRVMERCGLRYLRPGDEPGTLRHLRTR
ncbi:MULTISPECIES: GNAT family N-acetyltransferase [Myxococcaceae]|uniref:GNAT family N-acetyltransferase n=1 Tax=Myxococcaceae TaxID=31 RepID=UPI00188EE35A|nr:GNAT family N-acetyltransferase [Simulacricoccus sp. 17bor-14]